MRGQRPPGSRRERVGSKIAGLVVLGLGLLNLGRSATPLPTPATGRGAPLHGLYRYVRHPIYTGVMALAVGSVDPVGEPRDRYDHTSPGGVARAQGSMGGAATRSTVSRLRSLRCPDPALHPETAFALTERASSRRKSRFDYKDCSLMSACPASAHSADGPVVALDRAEVNGHPLLDCVVQDIFVRAPGEVRDGVQQLLESLEGRRPTFRPHLAPVALLLKSDLAQFDELGLRCHVTSTPIPRNICTLVNRPSRSSRALWRATGPHSIGSLGSIAWVCSDRIRSWLCAIKCLCVLLGVPGRSASPKPSGA